MKDWVWNIFIITTSLAFVEILLPDGNIRKYLKFIFSIFILAVIVFPFGDKSLGQISETFSSNKQNEYVMTNEGGEMLERILSTQTRQIEDIYKEKKDRINEDANQSIKGSENTGISLPWTDIYSNDEEEQN